MNGPSPVTVPHGNGLPQQQCIVAKNEPGNSSSQQRRQLVKLQAKQILQLAKVPAILPTSVLLLLFLLLSLLFLLDLLFLLLPALRLALLVTFALNPSSAPPPPPHPRRRRCPPPPPPPPPPPHWPPPHPPRPPPPRLLDLLRRSLSSSLLLLLLLPLRYCRERDVLCSTKLLPHTRPYLVIPHLPGQDNQRQCVLSMTLQHRKTSKVYTHPSTIQRRC